VRVAAAPAPRPAQRPHDPPALFVRARLDHDRPRAANGRTGAEDLLERSYEANVACCAVCARRFGGG
jgi:hypothetical protein